MPIPRMPGILLAALLAAAPLTAQNLVLDQGVFVLTVGGRPAGREEFAIRQAGVGTDGTLIANANVTLDGPEGIRQIQVVLSADPTAGSARRYQVEVSGAESMELVLSLMGDRYLSVTRSAAGEEERELPARPGTRILDAGVAHHYYFLRDQRQGAEVPVIEPRSGRRLRLVASSSTEEPVRLGANTVSGRRVVFGVDGDRRVVWYDVQGRVIRVEIPSTGYVAEREDLVG